MEVRNAEYAANKTNDVTYDAKFTIRQNVFLTSSGGLAINYVFSCLTFLKVPIRYLRVSTGCILGELLNWLLP